MQAAAAFSFLPFGYSEIFGVVKKIAIRQKKRRRELPCGRATTTLRQTDAHHWVYRQK
jgi:hypothetical protein